VLAQQDPAIEIVPVARLRPYAGNARTHSRKQVRQIAESIGRFGFTNPVLISQDDEIIAGHGRVAAAKLIGLHSVPALRLSHLDATQRRAYVLADNKLALNAEWDSTILATEFRALADVAFDLDLTGFSLPEVELVLEAPAAAPPPGEAAGERPPRRNGAAAHALCVRGCHLLRSADGPGAADASDQPGEDTTMRAEATQ
jgi:ParB-like chromosome segregation protein Spo0J